MLAQLKSEFRKLFTVRSTYILIIVAILLTVLFSYFGTSTYSYEEAVCESTGEVLYSNEVNDERLGFGTPEEICGGQVTYTTKTESNLPKEKLLSSLQETLPLTVTFTSIVLVLLVAHEFRYNTISYTLTISNSRSKILVAKIIAGSLFTLLTTLLAIAVTFATVYLAINVKNLYLPDQDYNWLYVLSRHIIYALGTTLIFMGISLLVRNLVASIASVFILPIVDGIAGLLLMTRDIEPTKVLPFSALERFGNVVSDLVPSYQVERFGSMDGSSQATVVGSLLVFGLYFVVIWSLAWYTFLRRDAN